MAQVVRIQLGGDPARREANYKVIALLANGEAIDLPPTFEGESASKDAADWQASLMRKIAA